MRFLGLVVAASLLLPPGCALAASPALTVVAAENFYGGLAQVVAGAHASVVSILSNPDQDPHLFEADPKTARALAGASVVIANGADYDPWIDKLLGASARKDRVVITVADLIGLDMRNRPFQTAVMNGTEPSPADVAAFEDDLRSHKVAAMLYNSQADDAAVKRLVGIARDAHVPVVGVTETEPADKSYEAWMMSQLDALDTALASGRS